MTKDNSKTDAWCHHLSSHTSETTPAIDLAQVAILKGLPVFPCDAAKKPITPKGFYDASKAC